MFKEMHQFNVFQIVGFLLERIAPQYLSVETVTRLEQLAALLIHDFGKFEGFELTLERSWKYVY